MRLIVAGGRWFNDYDLMKSKLDFFLKDTTEPIEIVSSKAQGADTLGERYARENGYPIKEFYAQWGKYNRGAGPIRNGEMARYATHCVVFWDGESTGSGNMIEQARDMGLSLRIVNY